MSSKRETTIFEPPPVDSSKAAIENVLELTPISDIGPDVFTNTRPLWHPPGARGIFGGAVIAQCLSAAQRTVPDNFFVHSMHCYFVLAGDSEIPIVYHVERVRTGRSYATRTVQARQRGKPIFTTTLSFNAVNSGGIKRLEHESKMPDAPPPKDLPVSPDARSPFESQRLDDNPHTISEDIHIEDRKLRQWIRIRGKISEAGGHQAHLSAFAYMSDSYFIGTVSRLHKIPRFSSPQALQRALKALKNPSDLDSEALARYFKDFAEEEAAEIRADSLSGTLTANKLSSIIRRKDNREIGMMVSLDHTIYFHNPQALRADDWLLASMDSPWAGEGRGLVTQKVWSREGVHVATCVQEGVVRLRQDEDVPPESKL